MTVERGVGFSGRYECLLKHMLPSLLDTGELEKAPAAVILNKSFTAKLYTPA